MEILLKIKVALFIMVKVYKSFSEYWLNRGPKSVYLNKLSFNYQMINGINGKTLESVEGRVFYDKSF